MAVDDHEEIEVRETFEANEPVDGNESSDESAEEDKTGPRLLTQDHLSDLIRNLGLDKDRAELLASRLQENGLLEPKTNLSAYRNRKNDFLQYFVQKESLVYCHDIPGLMNKMKSSFYKDEEWRLFLDARKRSLKAVILHNENKYASIPVGHSVVLRESYETFKLLLQKLKYSYGKNQVISFIGMQNSMKINRNLIRRFN